MRADEPKVTFQGLLSPTSWEVTRSSSEPIVSLRLGFAEDSAHIDVIFNAGDDLDKIIEALAKTNKSARSGLTVVRNGPKGIVGHNRRGDHGGG